MSLPVMIARGHLVPFVICFCPLIDLCMKHLVSQSCQTQEVDGSAC